MWALILVIAIRAVFERSLDWTALAVLLMGWMAMLSWGYELPALMAGSMCLVVANWAFADVRQEMFVVGRRSVLVAVATAAAFGLFLYTADREVSARESQPFYDVPLGRLTASVGDVDPDFRGIKTGQATSDYMHGLQRCLRRYPAKWVAILPDNPGIYPAMGLHSPFPIDWFWKTDMSHQLGRIIDAGVDLNRRGNYLVLFQTASGLFLRTEHHLPDATRRSIPVMISEPILYNAPLAEALINVLHGRRVVCGSFLGIYAR